MERFSADLARNFAMLQNSFGDAADFYTKQLHIGGEECVLCMFDGLTNTQKVWQLLLEQLNAPAYWQLKGERLYRKICERSDFPIENTPVETIEDATKRLTAGMALLFIHGCPRAIAISAPGLAARSVGAPNGEGNLHGSQIGFTEQLRTNVSQLRALIRTQNLCVQYGQAGERTNTEYAVCYDKTLADPEMVDRISKKIEELRLPILLDSMYLSPFLRGNPFHLFAGLGTTERPATACAKLCEGKVIVLVNGSPFALILPYFFSEHFESLDDYSATALFASMVRILKYIAFFIAILFPGIYVMCVSFTPELLPYKLMERIAEGEEETPMPILLEMLFVLLVLEIIREAGLRMPKQLGHSVSLVAALIIGDTAVEAGMMSVPVLSVAAIASIATYVIPSLYEQITILRFGFTLLCGFFGLAGLSCGLFVLLAMVCSESQGYPYTFPLIPLNALTLRDGVLRLRWQTLSENSFTLREIKENENE